MRSIMANGLEWLDKLLRWYIICLMALLVALTFIQVVARYVMSSPFTGTDQLARIASVWLTFMGAAVAVWKNKNIRIDTIEQFLPEPVRKAMFLIFDLLLIVLLAVMSVKAYEVTEMGATQDIIATPFSYAVMYSSLFVGSVLMLLFVVLRTLSRVGLLDPCLHQKGE
jgi:TRAP-type C4-dicarboxylate transport system permease small subunit